MSLVGFTQITSAQINQTYTTGNDIALGTFGADRRGNVYAWTQNGAVALATGLANISPAKVANDTNRSLDANSLVAAGSTKLTYTSGGTVTADLYKGGYLVVNDGTGKGQILEVTGNSVDYTGGAAHAVDVYFHDSLIAAVSTSDTKVELLPNPWSAVVVHPGSSSSYMCPGVNETAVAASSYFWSKVRGLTSVLSDGVIAKAAGAILTANAVVGAVTTEATTTVTQRLGFAPEATVDAKYYGVYLTIV